MIPRGEIMTEFMKYVDSPAMIYYDTKKVYMES